jgi:hypothetical protein
LERVAPTFLIQLQGKMDISLYALPLLLSTLLLGMDSCASSIAKPTQEEI